MKGFFKNDSILEGGFFKILSNFVFEALYLPGRDQVRQGKTAVRGAPQECKIRLLIKRALGTVSLGHFCGMKAAKAQ
jgi:hypothetical protein